MQYTVCAKIVCVYTTRAEIEAAGKMVCHKHVVQWRRKLASQQKITVNKSLKARNTNDLESMNVKAVIKEAVIFLLDTMGETRRKTKAVEH